MNLIVLLIIVILVVSLLGAPGIGPWHHSFGWGPSGIGTLIIIILFVLLLTGRL